MKSIATSIAAAILLAAVAVAQTTHYTVTDLGPVGAYGQPFGNSNNGLIAGVDASGSAAHAVVWYRGQKTDIGQIGFGGPNSTGFDVNVKAQIVGQAETSTLEPYGEDFCGYGTNLVCLPFLGQNGAMAPLPTLGGQSGLANAINTRGQVVGAAENARWDITCPAPQKFEFKPVIWNSGQAQELLTAAGDLNGAAFAINDNGQAVGASGSCSAYSPYLLASFQPLHALLWQNGIATDLGNLGGKGTGFGHVAFGINNQGQVTGNSDLPGDQNAHAFLWQNGRMTDLGTLPGDVSSFAIAINDSSVVVGGSQDKDNNSRAMVVQSGVLHDLNDLVPADSPLYLTFACSINSSGEIDGVAVNKVTGKPLPPGVERPAGAGAEVHPLSIGRPCGKGASAIRRSHSPAR